MTGARMGHPALWLVCGILTVLTIIRVVSMLRFEERDARGIASPRRYLLLYCILGTLHVLTVGAWTTVVFWVDTDPLSELIALSTAVGFMVGIQGRNFASPATVSLQLVALAVPVATAFLVKNSGWYLVCGLFFAVFMLSVLANSRRVGKTFLDALNTARINQDLAHRDSLTGLPNRAATQRMISAGVERLDQPFALHFLDLDKFKRVNDTLGHSAGDRLLLEAARRFTATAGESCVVARHAGDEFVILQYGIGSRQDAADLAAALIATCNDPYDLGATVANIGCSIGTAIFPEDATSAEHLLQRADVALYHVKHNSRNSFAFYETAMADAEQERLAIETDLRGALECDGELYMVFQPIIRTRSMEVASFEALVRWKHPTRGIVPPAEFLPIAEESGLIGRVTDKTVAIACRAAASWPGDVAVAINISPSQLQRSDLQDMILRNLAESGLPAHRLEVELTENLFVGCDSETMRQIRALRDLGVRFSIDDFGTGYSNLGYINNLPIDKVKIDRSFLTGVFDDARRQTLLRGLIAFIAELDLITVIEGVETHDQLDMLERNPNAHEVQGFVFGGPLSTCGVQELLRRSRPMSPIARQAAQ
ncbi:bifunctional diguanylate cyclase/phosphodiesterase [Aurantimonas sp. HBX-1]|uniref:putative bifunctional diguanylate cyclase/phosphodiesterase n=1 Tax=Aurantimonas sp. HBX-1 TaxID=2906072 RepID=UPI001F45B2D6|nr:EAL domain-containing protein [Aurantimonas sp. HBX-1]UIJ72808.1 EAL domain-containing protein [Aurantimonas sp. HBX-1]